MLAAAGMHALDHHVERLAEDHKRAITVAKALDAMKSFSVDMSTVQTNMVYVKCTSAASEVASELQKNGVDVFDISPTHIRVVTHLHITDEDIEAFIILCKRLFDS